MKYLFEFFNALPERIKSPVVIVQIITIIATMVIVLIPSITEQVKAVVVGITSLINIYAGMNNPTTPHTL